jgi:hypothetical protein
MLGGCSSSPKPMPPRSAPSSVKRESCRQLSSCAGGSQESPTTRRRGRAPGASPGARRCQPACARRPNCVPARTASHAPGRRAHRELCAEVARYGDADSGQVDTRYAAGEEARRTAHGGVARSVMALEIEAGHYSSPSANAGAIILDRDVVIRLILEQVVREHVCERLISGVIGSSRASRRPPERIPHH